jgi:hypothetical protein
VRIIKTTDNQHLGLVLPDLNTGDSVDLEGFTFYVQSVRTLDSGNVLFANPNYQLECEAL